MISDTLTEQINKALKAGEELRVSTLKMLKAALTNALIENKREPLSEEQEIVVVKREAKKRRDAIELYKKGKALDKAKKEEDELEILKEYLPEEMGDGELEKIVQGAIKQVDAKSMADMGKVMGVVMGKTKGQADGGRVSALVKKTLG